MNSRPRDLPDAVWNAFFVLILICALIGILCGLGLFSGVALAVFMGGTILAFVIWAVLHIDPGALAEEPDYRDGKVREREGS